MEETSLMNTNPQIVMWFLGFLVALASVIVVIAIFRIKDRRIKEKEKKDEAVQRQKEKDDQRAFVISEINTQTLKIKELEAKIGNQDIKIAELYDKYSEIWANIEMQEKRNVEYYNEVKDQLHSNNTDMLKQTQKVFKEIIAMIHEHEKESDRKYVIK